MNCDVVRESFIGQLIYYASGHRYFRYEEDMPDYILPEKYARLVRKSGDPETNSTSDASTLALPGSDTSSTEERRPRSVRRKPVDEKAKAEVRLIERQSSDDSADNASEEIDSARTKQIKGSDTTKVVDPEKGNVQVEEQRVEEKQENPFVVDWYSSTDPENPRNVRVLHNSPDMLNSRAALYLSVVLRETLFRYIRYLPSYIQYLHRVRHLCPRYPRYLRKIRHLKRSSIFGYNSLRPRLRYRSHVPITSL